MKSKGIRHLWVIVVCSVFSVCSLESCLQYALDAKVYFNNTTSDTIFVTSGDALIGEVNDKDLNVSRAPYYLEGSLSVGPGESLLVLREIVICDAPKERDIPQYMQEYYPNGLKITLKDGSTIIYSPDSITTDSYSPYIEDSYRFELGESAPWPFGCKSGIDAFYVISDMKSKE
jgi:hypothetical protein